MQLPSATPYFIHDYVFVEKGLDMKFAKILCLENSPNTVASYYYVMTKVRYCNNAYSYMYNIATSIKTMPRLKKMSNFPNKVLAKLFEEKMNKGNINSRHHYQQG